MTSFNIGSQSAGIINMVGGDQHVNARQSVSVVTVDDARAATRALDRALGEAPLDAATAAVGRRQVEEIETELAREQPDPRKVAPLLRRLAETLSAAGALATASTGLAAPLATLATWLRDLGAPVLQLLAR